MDKLEKVFLYVKLIMYGCIAIYSLVVLYNVLNLSFDLFIEVNKLAVYLKTGTMIE